MHTTSLPQPNRPDASTLMVYFDDEDAAAKVLERIREAGLFKTAVDFDEKFRRLILDPDGRQVEICSPHPFRV